MADDFKPTSPFRITRLRQFLPLSDDVISTRGQSLPSLIRSISTASLHDLRLQGPQRRPSRVARGEEGGEMDIERNCDSRKGEDARMTPQMRSMRLIGNSNPRYQWHRYYKSEEELKGMKKSLRKYYERNNFLISQYIYIDRLLDSSLPHNLIQEYQQLSTTNTEIPHTITEESSAAASDAEEEGSSGAAADRSPTSRSATQSPQVKVKRTPKDLYRVPTEDTPLLGEPVEEGSKTVNLGAPADEDIGSSSPIVTVAIYINLLANALLLGGKVAVIVLTSSLSVLASLVDAALDFLSTAIIWTTTKLISRQDQYAYPVGRRRLEPIGVLVFSVIIVVSFCQVALECLTRLTSGDHSIVQLGLPSIIIMASTVLIKFGCWLWCRMIKNSSVQALAQDAMTDVVFNVFSIIFPLIGYYAQIWWLDALGGLVLSLYVIVNWSRTSAAHIRNLTGAAASADERNVLLYLTMRFAKSIKQIQGLQAYHSGDRLNVEVDIVLDESMSLRDSHDVSESLQYVLESVPSVDRAFVHQDYAGYNLPSHLNQQD
ncbi:MAG: cation efflux family [Lasallia pustulata]|uniref:Cation efflux family n=1 Tax=Lasallia pustulata TaxID=136370 RepID=A0A5M8Q4H4_9LECA|nr:MAG: cation efflux family [Lasallia pustulata]